MNQTINVEECLEVVLTKLSDFMIPIMVLLTNSTLGVDKVEWFLVCHFL